ncbi:MULTISPECIES: DUF190 domain-containing protein [unclassified Paraburkholderia]|uniref:DUF190 domain-containing protein n=1 Tax=unclassified Paraburkholderia TaxID=2615204 RepID=UPI002AB05855|nr:MULTISPECIES: DUF190 domain-containing protein [unclassified Paraburkholderia]
MISENNHEHIAALRLYFPIATRARATRFWHRLSAPALAHHLIAVAKRSNIMQAMLHHVSAGYMPGERLSHHHPEVNGMRHPQCLELVDTETRLRQFMRDHAEELRKVHAVLLLCELPLGHRRTANALSTSTNG